MSHPMLGGALGAGFWLSFGAMLLMTHVTILSVTLYLHRSIAHRAAVFHPALAKFFRIWLWMSTGMSALEWAAVHRKHHAKCETPEDPHSPQQKGLWRVMWAGAWLYTQEAANADTIERFGKGAPNDKMEAFFRKHSLAGLGLMLGIDLALFGVWGFPVFVLQIAWIPFWAAGVVNGVGHFWGYRNFDSEDQSRNILPWGIIIGGEELHNNHHAFPSSAKLSCKKGEFDLGWAWLVMLERLNLVDIKRAARAPELGVEQAIDRGTLDAVLAFRHHAQADLRRALTPSLRAKFRAVLQDARDRGDSSLSGARFRHFRSWFFNESARKPRSAWIARFESIAHSDAALRKARESALSLKTLWERSHVTADELLERLKAWARDAESHPMDGFQQFIRRLSRYKSAKAA